MLEKLRVRHIIGILASITVATILSLIPFGVYISAPFEITPAEAAPVAVFFVFVLGFLMNNALHNGQELERYLNLELSRLRRLFHVTKNMNDKALHTKVKRAVYDYFDFLNTYGLTAYQGSNKKFRAVSYAIYSYSPKTDKQKIAYKELLDTLRECSATRQEIYAILHGGMKSYGWVVLGAMEVMVVVSTLLAQGTDVKDFVVNAATLSTIFIVTQLVYEADHYSTPQLRDIGHRYGASKRSLEQVGKKK